MVYRLLPLITVGLMEYKFMGELTGSREEEELALGLIDGGWDIHYSPVVTIRHYSNSRGIDLTRERRATDLKNGLLVLWRRFPFLLSLPAIGLRITCVYFRALTEDPGAFSELSKAIRQAHQDWKAAHCQRAPIRLRSFCRYLLLHFSN